MFCVCVYKCVRARERERERESVYICCAFVYVYTHARIHVCIHTQDEAAYNLVGTSFRQALNMGMGSGSKQIAEKDVDYQVCVREGR